MTVALASAAVAAMTVALASAAVAAMTVALASAAVAAMTVALPAAVAAMTVALPAAALTWYAAPPPSTTRAIRRIAGPVVRQTRGLRNIHVRSCAKPSSTLVGGWRGVGGWIGLKPSHG
ncbi:hypothetical protein ACH40E_15460 [Streptomyces acidicola]|uniref:hypothetical protein n=1 Tax=Streptomyces acidicola TaxID=2596892 RepID=UPI00379EDC44